MSLSPPRDSAGARWDIATLIALLALVGVLALLSKQHALFARGSLAQGVQIAAGLLMLWARVTFGTRSFHATASATAGGLVTHGPYRFWRHPIYAAVLYFVSAGILTHAAPLALALGGVTLVATAIRIAGEEHSLQEAFPGEYAAYAARTRRLISFVL